jgi:hypothetical protein
MLLGDAPVAEGEGAENVAGVLGEQVAIQGSNACSWVET